VRKSVGRNLLQAVLEQQRMLSRPKKRSIEECIHRKTVRGNRAGHDHSTYRMQTVYTRRSLSSGGGIVRKRCCGVFNRQRRERGCSAQLPNRSLLHPKTENPDISGLAYSFATDALRTWLRMAARSVGVGRKKLGLSVSRWKHSDRYEPCPVRGGVWASREMLRREGI